MAGSTGAPHADDEHGRHGWPEGGDDSGAHDQYRLPDGELDASAPQQVFVLSLSGGGYRGLFSARLLARIESELLGGSPIGSRFDLFAGTSVGGIIAAALAHGVSASAICTVLQAHGPSIFPERRFKAVRKLLGPALYSSEPVRAAIHACLSREQAAGALGRLRTPLLLTTVDWVSAELRLLGSAGTPLPDGLGLSVLDAMLATSAAPAHFVPHVAAGHSFVDGGLAANNPDLLALQVARQSWAGAMPRVLGIGTADPLGGGNPQAMPQRGFRWAAPVIELCMHAQERQASADCADALGSHYLRVNRHPSREQIAAAAFDTATRSSTEILIGLADQEFDAIRNDKARLARLLGMMRPLGN